MAGTTERPAMTAPAGALVEHILERYHPVHRRELAGPGRRARKVAPAHASDTNAPHGLARALGAMAADLRAHMRAQAAGLFPALAGVRPSGPI